uniref:C2H2-type domain-containing protein n=1 Tax=Sphenodon punctatus TaxID=8508 RepID=A0A8D0L8W0_SPHPU
MSSSSEDDAIQDQDIQDQDIQDQDIQDDDIQDIQDDAIQDIQDDAIQDIQDDAIQDDAMQDDTILEGAKLEGAKLEGAKSESEKKIYYCEVCKVPCMSSISLQSHFRGLKHKKREKALNAHRAAPVPAPAPIIYETSRPVKRPLTKNIRCLKDFMNDSKREEPLVGLEYVVEIRFEGRKEPHYECKLCEFNTEMAPMIEHLSGYKHRRAYISKEFPDKMKKDTPNAKEDKVSFLRRMSREIEKTEGLKMYKIEGYARPSKTSASSSKKKSRWDDYKPENDPIRKERALKYLETFQITTDKDATLVVRITQDLTEALKTFCKKKAAIDYTSSLRPLMSISQDEFAEGKDTPKQHKPYGNYQGGNKWNQDFLSQRPEQAPPAFQDAANASHSPASLYNSQTGDRSSWFGLRPNHSAAMSALSNSIVQTGGFATGINEWMKQFNQSASLPFQSTSVSQTSSYLECSGSGYSAEYKPSDSPGNTITMPENRMGCSADGTDWRRQAAFTDARHVPDSFSVAYPLPRGYSANYPLQGFPSSYSGEPVNANPLSAGSHWPQEPRCQNSSFRSDPGSYPSSSSGSSYRPYHQQGREPENAFGENTGGLTPSILSRLRGKDIPTMTMMLKQLAPYYPSLQKQLG